MKFDTPTYCFLNIEANTKEMSVAEYVFANT